MASKQSAAKEPEHTFETAIERLEHIVEEMESDKLPLEQLLVRYEEGTKLVKVCQEKLESAERRIEIITRNATGKPQLAEFEAGSAPAISSSSPLPAPSASAPAPKPSATAAEDVSLF